MRPLVALACGVFLVACTNQTNPATSPTPAPPAQSAAADFRAHLDLLLAEQVMIVAKESAAAVNHSDEYSAYTALLSVNSADLTTLIGRAYGNTAAAQFAQVWNSGNGYLVDYTIGVVTHNDDKATSATTNLTSTFSPRFAALIHGLSGLSQDDLAQLTAAQLRADKTFIDDQFAANFKAYYSDLDLAYRHTALLGDVLGDRIVTEFPDRFPGDATAQAVGLRASINVAMQEHSYLATMLTDAAVNGRDAEKVQALAAMTANVDSMRKWVGDQRFTLALDQEGVSIATYATNNDATSKGALIVTFVGELASITNLPRPVIATHEVATVKVIDDQRAKAAAIAGDDRAAATSTQPIADSAV